MIPIQTNKLTKVYRRFEKEPGLSGSVKSLFHRKYVDKTAVSAFDLTVEEGEFVGLIGPNGAGKTTLIKMLTGIIPPTSGGISVLGFTPNNLENAFKMQYAVVMGQKSQLMFELTPRDILMLFKEMYAIPDAEYAHNIALFTELFDVGSLMDVQVRTLSLGERMKMELIVALLHNPHVLFLDEPTIGLDAVAQRQIRTFLREVNREKGTTILLTSHYMEDIRSLCPRCVVVASGAKLYDGALDTLLSTYQQHKRITATYASAHEATLPDWAQPLEVTPYKMSVLIPRDRTQAFLGELVTQGDLADLAVEEEDIGIVVERIYAAGKEGTA